MSKKIRVALSGSGFKFPAHVGALCAIRDAGYEIVEYAGTSGGSIVSALAASGMSFDDMKVLTMTRDWSDMLTFDLSAIIERKGYCTGNTLLKFITSATKGLRFKELTTRLTIIASDLAHESQFVFNSEITPDTQISIAARSSASIPFVYSPVIFNSSILMDGGMTDNMPATKLIHDEIPRIGIELIVKEHTVNTDTSIWKLLPRVLDFMLNSTEEARIEEGKLEGSYFVQVETGFANSLDQNMSKEIRQQLFDAGYSSTANSLKTITSREIL